MNDAPFVVFVTLIGVIVAALLFFAGFDISKQSIKQNCERYGTFYIDDQRYNCEAAK